MQKKKILMVCDIILLVATFYFSTALLYKYVACIYESDIGGHVASAMSGDSYSIMGPLILIVNTIFHSDMAIAILLSSIVIITILITAMFIKKLLQSFDVNDFGMWEVMPIAISSIFICNIFIPKLWQYYYTSLTHVSQPWHNTTYLIVRLFGMAVLLIYFKIEKKYLEKIALKDLVIFTVLLVCANASKPNFILAFAPMMLVFLIVDFILTKTKSFANAVKFGVCVLISLLVLILQAKILYVDDTSSGIAFSMEKFYIQFMTPNAIIMIIANLAFPLLVTVALLLSKNRDKYATRVLFQGWCMYIVSRLEGIFLVETGVRASHGNFTWGTYLFGYILYMICISEWISARKKNIIKNNALYYAGYMLYGLSVATGIIYFLYLNEGYFYIM